MHVCLIENTGGTRAETTRAEARRLREAGLDVSIVAGGEARLALSPPPEGCRLVCIEPPGLPFPGLRMTWTLARRARALHADIYHAHSTCRLMLLAAIVARSAGKRFCGDFNVAIVTARGPASSRPASTELRFEQPDHWQRELSENERSRLEATLALIPDDVESALDVGCGDGRLTNRLADTVEHVTGLDNAAGALRFLAPPIEAVQGSADDLPFADARFDLVLATELIEHLPDGTLRRVLTEIERVARRYILIGVPLQEQLAIKDLICPFDGCRFNVNGHRQHFGRRRFDGLLAGFRLVRLTECGAPRRFYYHPLLRWIRQRIGGVWARPPYSICPRCGTNLYGSDLPERNAVTRWCDERNKRIRERRRLGRSHVVALYERIAAPPPRGATGRGRDAGAVAAPAAETP